MSEESANFTADLHTQPVSESFGLCPGVRGYDPDNAYYMCEASQLVYTDEAKNIEQYKQWGFSDVKFFSDPHIDTQVAVATTDSVITVTFRGSESLQDWLSDASIVLVPTPMGYVHAGFLNALNAVWDGVKNTVEEFGGKSKSLIISGHSLGAALSTLCAARFEIENDHIPSCVYNYGSPRVGGVSFYRKFSSTEVSKFFWRVVNNNDIVCKIPTNLNGYLHVGKLVYIDSDGNIKHGGYWWNNLQDLVVGSIRSPLRQIQQQDDVGPDLVTDHYIKNYLRPLKKAM